MNNGWEILELKKVLQRVRKPVDVKKGENYKQIGIRSHGKGLFYKEPVTGEELGNKSVFWIEPECFIVNIVFAWEMAVGKTTINEKGMIASHRFPMYKPKDNRISIDYLIYYFKSQRGRLLLELASPGGAGRNKTLGQTEFMNIKIAFPPLGEQQKIVSIFSIWDKAIELKEKLIEEKKNQMNGLMQKILTGKVRLSGFEGTWEDIKLKSLEDENLITMSRGKVISRKDIDSCPGNYPVYSSSVKNNGYFGSYGEYMFDEELITWSVDGGGDFFYRNKHKFSITNVSGYIRVLSDKINCEFLAYQLQFLQRKLMFDYTTKAHPSVIRELYEVQLPNREEQDLIVEVLNMISKEKNLYEMELKNIIMQKKGLMQLLLTGIVRVNVEMN